MRLTFKGLLKKEEMGYAIDDEHDNIAWNILKSSQMFQFDHGKIVFHVYTF